MDTSIASRKQGGKLSLADKGHIQEIIVTLLLRHARPSEINEACRQFGLTERSIRRYVAKAREYIAEKPLETAERAKRIVLAELEEELRRAEHSRDRIDIIKYRAKLLGLEDIEVNINHKYSSIPTEKLIEVIQDE